MTKLPQFSGHSAANFFAIALIFSAFRAYLIFLIFLTCLHYLNSFSSETYKIDFVSDFDNSLFYIAFIIHISLPFIKVRLSTVLRMIILILYHFSLQYIVYCLPGCLFLLFLVYFSIFHHFGSRVFLFTHSFKVFPSSFLSLTISSFFVITITFVFSVLIIMPFLCSTLFH